MHFDYKEWTLQIVSFRLYIFLRFVDIHFSCTGFNYNSWNKKHYFRIIIIHYFRFIGVGLQYKNGFFTYFLLSKLCDLIDCLPCGYQREGCVGCIGRGAGYVEAEIWFGTFTFKVISLGLLVFFCGISLSVIQIGMFNRFILSIRQQVKKGSKMIFDISEIPFMTYTVLAKCLVILLFMLICTVMQIFICMMASSYEKLKSYICVFGIV